MKMNSLFSELLKNIQPDIIFTVFLDFQFGKSKIRQTKAK